MWVSLISQKNNIIRLLMISFFLSMVTVLQASVFALLDLNKSSTLGRDEDEMLGQAVYLAKKAFELRTEADFRKLMAFGHNDLNRLMVCAKVPGFYDLIEAVNAGVKWIDLSNIIKGNKRFFTFCSQAYSHIYHFWYSHCITCIDKALRSHKNATRLMCRHNQKNEDSDIEREKKELGQLVFSLAAKQWSNAKATKQTFLVCKNDADELLDSIGKKFGCAMDNQKELLEEERAYQKSFLLHINHARAEICDDEDCIFVNQPFKNHAQLFNRTLMSSYLSHIVSCNCQCGEILQDAIEVKRIPYKKIERLFLKLFAARGIGLFVFDKQRKIWHVGLPESFHGK